MDNSKKTILVFSGNLVKSEKLKQDLETAGISVFIKNHDRAASSTGFANITHEAIELSILETDIEKAKPVVAKFKERFGF